VGTTTAIDFPPTTGAFQTTCGGGPGGGSTFGDAFIAKIDPSQAGSASLLYSTYLGGSGRDIGGGIPLVGIGGGGIAVDVFGYTYVTGSTASTDFPTTTGAIQTTYGAGAEGGNLLGMPSWRNLNSLKLAMHR